MKFFRFFLLMFCPILMGLVSCSNSDEPNDPNQDNNSQLTMTKLSGYWQIQNSYGNNSKYYFVSFNSKGEYAIYIGDDVFGSGIYDINNQSVTATSGFNGNILNFTITNVNDNNLNFTLNSKNYTALKTSKSPVNLESILIGKSCQSYLGSGSDRKTIDTEFITKYDGKRTLNWTLTKKYHQYLEYVYTGEYLFIKRYEDKNVQNPSIGGWNNFNFNTVWINDIEIKNGSVSFWTVEGFEK